MEWIRSFNLMIMTDTKITEQDYWRNSMGYNVVCFQSIPAAAGDAKGGSGPGCLGQSPEM